MNNSLGAKKAWITKKKNGFDGIKRGLESPLYKNSKISYSSVHSWLIRTYGKATYCSNDKTHKSIKFEWANISGEYKRDINDYKPLCVKCHDIFDDIYRKRPQDMYKRGWETRAINGFKVSDKAKKIMSDKRKLYWENKRKENYVI